MSIPTPIGVAPPPPSSQLPPPGSASPTDTQPRQSSVEWHADRLLAQLGSLTHLEPHIQQRVRTALIKQQSARYSGSIRFEAELRDALGAQAAEIEHQILANQQAERQRILDQERSALTHQLGLSAGQEDQLGLALQRVDDSIAPIRIATEKLVDDAMGKHQNPEVNRDVLREAMTQIEQSQDSIRRTRKESLATELRHILSPEQYQKWLNQAGAE
jgi:hypothetical protein